MKKLIGFSLVVAALVFGTGQAAASPLSISGMAMFNRTNYLKGTNYIATMDKMSFNNAFIYNWISNAVAHASNGLAATLPAKGYFDYYPEAYDGKYYGLFFVTDKTNYYYPLSGLDTNDDHYSFMELNTYDWWFRDLGCDDDCCCDCPGTNSIYLANYSEKTGDGSYDATDIAKLYIRSYPYRDQTNDPEVMTLLGTFKPSLHLKDYYLYSPSTATFTGTGNFLEYHDGVYDKGLIQAMTLKFNF